MPYISGRRRTNDWLINEHGPLLCAVRTRHKWRELLHKQCTWRRTRPANVRDVLPTPLTDKFVYETVRAELLNETQKCHAEWRASGILAAAHARAHARVANRSRINKRDHWCIIRDISRGQANCCYVSMLIEQFAGNTDPCERPDELNRIELIELTRRPDV